MISASQMKTLPALTDFLNLNIGSVTDAYLRELAQQNHRTQLRTQQMEILLQAVQAMGQNMATLTDIFASKAIAEAKERAATAVKVVEIANATWVENRYRIRADHTVVDEDTGLMWMHSPLEGTFTFEAACQAAQNLNAQKGFAGYADWRVPSQDELLSLVVEGNYPCICQEAFPETPEAWFWTATPDSANAGNAWTIYFGYGGVYTSDRSYFNHVRLVRSRP